MHRQSVTIYHNPACGTSRTVLGLIRDAGYEPVVVEYLKTGWTRPLLCDLLAALRVRPRDVLRTKGTDAEALGLTAATATDDQIIDAMLEQPLLVNRPIVVTPKGARLCRPADRVHELL